MGIKRKFSDEFKLAAVELAERGDKSVLQVSKDLGIHHTVLRDWMEKFGKNNKQPSEVVTPSERAELVELRRKVARLEEEREILKKAMGIFTRELP